jgi:predicted esterase YcpF (UPF0227 family)
MGGFYGQYLARRLPVAHIYLINPALTPWDLFPPYLGQTMTTAQGETYRVTAELIEATRPFGIGDPCDGVPTTVFLDAGDEVIAPHIAQDIYRDCGDVRLYPGGDHAFQHLDELIASIAEFLGRRAPPQVVSNSPLSQRVGWGDLPG